MANNFQLSSASSPDVNSDFSKGSVFFIGTATVIIRYAGFTILTDPNFLHAGDHVHLGYGLTSERLTEPALDIDELPPIDLCVLSHYHGDHFDQIVEEKLNKDLPIVTTNHAVGELEARLSVEPENHELRLRLAARYVRVGRPDLARPQVDRVLKRAPGDPEALRLAAQIAARPEPSL